MKKVLFTSKVVYGILSAIALFLALTIGTYYIKSIAAGVSGRLPIISWIIYALAIFLNLYYGYFASYLRGVGAIQSICKIITITRIILIFLAIAALTVTIGGLVIFRRQVVQTYKDNGTDTKTYDKSYALITKDLDDSFWKQVYEEMQRRGDEENIYVEHMGNNLAVKYSVKELMDIAIASKADGIILEADNSEDMALSIEKAEQAGIPVVTVWSDAIDSLRKSYVGLSYYNLGSEYGKLICMAAKEMIPESPAPVIGKNVQGIRTVILIDKDASDFSQNTIILGIQDEISHSSLDANALKTEIVSISNENEFSAEEQIRELFNSEELPGIVICLNQTNTVSVYQTVVEKNLVGDTTIIGYSDAEIILNAIEKNNIYASIAVDGIQMADYCVEALNDYMKYGRTSDYYAVDFTCINNSNVMQYKRQVEAD